jgi:hypothetical protein
MKVNLFTLKELAAGYIIKWKRCCGAMENGIPFLIF